MHTEGAVHLGTPPMPEFPECWYVSGYYESIEILKSDLFVHDRSKVSHAKPLANFSGEPLKFWQQVAEWPLFLDAPEHTQKRLMVASFFRAIPILKLEKAITDIANELLDHALLNDTFDAMWDFAYPLTLRIICQILGSKTPDIPWFKNCTKELANTLDFRNQPHNYQPSLSAVSELNRFIYQQMLSRNEIGGHTLFKHLLGSERLDNEIDVALISLFLQILFAGQETASDSIGNGLLLLRKKPDLIPEFTKSQLIPNNLISEMLRHDTSIQFSGIRTAIEDFDVGCVKIHEGDSVVIALGACNHDPKRFQQPDRFDIKRDFTGPELAFGHGIHYCLGVHLAKLEMRIAFETLLRRLPITWHIKDVDMRKNLLFRGPRSLTIQLK